MLNFFCSIGQLRVSGQGFHLQTKKAKLSFPPKSDNVAFFTPFTQESNLQFASPHLIEVFESELRQFVGSEFKSRKLRSIELIFPTEWGRYFLVPPLKNTKDISDYSGAMRKRFMDLFSEDVSAWQLRMDFSFSGASFACALPSKLIEICSNVCRDHDVHLLGLKTELIESLNALATSTVKVHDQDWICIQGSDLCRVLIRDAGTFKALAHFVPNDVAKDSGFEVTLTRLALRHGLDRPQRCIVIGDGLPAWNSQMMKIDSYWVCTTSSSPTQQEKVAT